MGLDPIAARRAVRDSTAGVPTFSTIASEVIKQAQSKSTNHKVRYQWELLLGSRYCGPILHKPISEITTLDLEFILRPVWRTKPENWTQAPHAASPSLRLRPSSTSGQTWDCDVW